MSLTKVTYSMIDGPNVNVKDFGAVGDGTTDDTLAIQAAIDSASITGGQIVFENGSTYISTTLIPKSNVTLNLCGSTIKLKNNTFDILFNGNSTSGNNFAIVNGTLNCNKANNIYNSFTSGSAIGMTGWTGFTLKDLIIRDCFRASITFAGCTDVTIENIQSLDHGIVNPYNKSGYALATDGDPSYRVYIRNFYVYNMYGFGVHLIGVEDFVVENLVFDEMSENPITICLTCTESKRGIVNNVSMTNITGNGLESNACEDITFQNILSDTVSGEPFKMGDNLTGKNNQRVNVNGFVTVATGATRVGNIDYLNQCVFENLIFDKSLESSYFSGVGETSQNIIKNSQISGAGWTYLTYNNYFELQNVSFPDSDFYVEYKNPYSTKISGSLNLAIAGVGYINLNSYNSMGSKGFISGNLKLISWYDSQQGTLSQCPFIASNDNTNFNLGSITNTANGTARTMTITSDAANRRFVITNGSGVAVSVNWILELVGLN